MGVKRKEESKVKNPVWHMKKKGVKVLTEKLERNLKKKKRLEKKQGK